VLPIVNSEGNDEVEITGAEIEWMTLSLSLMMWHSGTRYSTTRVHCLVGSNRSSGDQLDGDLYQIAQQHKS
jgi:hypothetical protein